MQLFFCLPCLGTFFGNLLTLQLFKSVVIQSQPKIACASTLECKLLILGVQKKNKVIANAETTALTITHSTFSHKHGMGLVANHLQPFATAVGCHPTAARCSVWLGKDIVTKAANVGDW